MTLGSRSRMISFRVSAEEYKKLRDLCFADGMRSFSEMARAAMNLMLLRRSAAAPGLPLETRVAEIEARMDFLAREVERLHQNAADLPSA